MDTDGGMIGPMNGGLIGLQAFRKNNEAVHGTIQGFKIVRGIVFALLWFNIPGPSEGYGMKWFDTEDLIVRPPAPRDDPNDWGGAM